MFLTTRKYATLTLLISGILLTAPVKADNQGSQFSLSLDALGQGIKIPYSSAVSFGGGGQVFLDWRPFQFISLGFGGQYAYYPMPFTFQLASFDVGGRIFPGTTTSLGEFYLQGGVGRVLIVNPRNYPGSDHGYAGLGWRQFMGRDVALDLGAQYDFYSPISLPLNAASVKIGLTFLLGRDDWSEPEVAYKPRPRTIVVGADWRGPSTFKWDKEKDLRTVAYQVYGDESLYPLIIDANKDLIARQGLRPGLLLKIPPPPKTEMEIDHIEKAALSDVQYLRLEKKSEGRISNAFAPAKSTYQWKYGDDLLSVAEKLYGDEALYPLLVDANSQKLVHPANLVPGKVLKVPALPSEDILEGVRKNAWDDPHYLWWLNISKEHNANIVAPSWF